MELTQLKTIAYMRSDFKTKFGIPRQSGLVPALDSAIVFEPPYRNADAVRGLNDFSHIWLIWGFSEAIREQWSPTVRPPRLGGNERMGVFATRSPYRPNAIGLSSVELYSITCEKTLGPVLHVRGADLMDGTPIYDIKPYLPYADSHTNATGGFTDAAARQPLVVSIPSEMLSHVPPQKRDALREVLAQDPRPSYQSDPKRIYGMEFGDLEIKFHVENDTLSVICITPLA